MTDIRQRLQTTLGTGYALERELGGGGMSRVFVATDAALNRRVVVKLLAPELAQELSAERFAREIKLAAALQDPHIVPVLSAGESDGLPYYTMPFVEGDSLRARLLRGPIPMNDAVSILRDVALALEYAHAHGIVHRDIKPENVLLAGRTAVVADFGIAKAVSAARTGPGTRAGTLTSIGQSLGTPAYMAPEQVAGELVDHRADLYAWGIVAYELLGGRHPFAGGTSAAQLMAAQLSERPAPLIDTKPGLPPPLAALVMQCLEKARDARPQSAGQVVEALAATQSPSVGTGATQASTSSLPLPSSGRRRRLGVSLAVGVVALGAAGLVLARRGSALSSSAANARSIAVLPFENLGDSADAYFTDGITDAVRGKLTSLPGVAVIDRGSSVQYRKTAKLPRDIAKELGVRYLLTGTVRFAGSADAKRVQVSPELVEIDGDGRSQSRWEQPFDAEVRDVFRVQGDIAGKVAEAMQVALGGGAQQQLAKAPTTNSVAYDAFLRGEEALNEGFEDPTALRRAADYYEQAVAHDSTMVDAWGALGRAYSFLYRGEPTARVADAALTAARRALALDPEANPGHRAMAAYDRYVRHDLSGGLREIELARRAAPNSPQIIAAEASFKTDLGRLEEGLSDGDAAIRLDPRNAGLWILQADAFLRLHRLAEARAAADHGVALAPGAASLRVMRVIAEAASGNLLGARQAVADAIKSVSASRVLSFAAADDMGWVLDSAATQQLLALGPEAFGNERGAWAYARAEQYGWSGDTVQARAWGDSASRAIGAELKEKPNDAQRHVALGLMLAYAGRGREAMDESARGLALVRADTAARMSMPNAGSTYTAAWTALIAGDRDKALELLAESMRLGTYVTPAWLRIDPTWKSLRGDPRFEKLATAP
jgi:eukaryotic-like serine/threonine-protein kinase